MYVLYTYVSYVCIFSSMYVKMDKFGELFIIIHQVFFCQSNMFSGFESQLDFITTVLHDLLHTLGNSIQEKYVYLYRTLYICT